MIRGLERFVAALREDGVSVSTAEWLDALRAVEAIGVDDRERFRAALRCTLVKRDAARDVFDRLFDRCFAAPRRGRRRGGRPAAGGVAAGASGRPADGPPTGRAGPTSATPRNPGTKRRDVAAFRRSLARLRQGGATRCGRLRHVDAAARRRDEQDPRAPRAAPARQDPRRVDLRARLGTSEERELAAAVPAIVERLRLRTARRLRRATRGAVALRHVFRENASHGGIPFVVPARVRRSRRPHVTLLIDVSWSVARAAGLFLSIAGAFLGGRRDVRVVVFVDRAVDATRDVRRWLDARHADNPVAERRRMTRAGSIPGAGVERGGVSFTEMLGGVVGLDLTAPSDYGRAFHDLLRSPARPRGRGTLLLVLGDGRTNRYDPQGWAFDELAGGCGAVLWLVPEAVDTWCSGDSALDSYLPACDTAIEARDLRGLERGVAALVRRL